MIQRFTALSVDVCRANSAVAMHFTTQHGVVIIVLSDQEFQEKCRGPLDHNRNHLGKVVDAVAETILRQPTPALIEVPAALEDADDGELRGYKQRRENYRQVFLATRRNPEQQIASICHAFRVEPNRYYAWLSHQYHRAKNPIPEIAALRELAEAARTDGVRPPVLKPGGKVL